MNLTRSRLVSSSFSSCSSFSATINFRYFSSPPQPTLNNSTRDQVPLTNNSNTHKNSASSASSASASSSSSPSTYWTPERRRHLKVLNFALPALVASGYMLLRHVFDEDFKEKYQKYNMEIEEKHKQKKLLMKEEPNELPK
jgi:hypothetical protein